MEERSVLRCGTLAGPGGPLPISPIELMIGLLVSAVGAAVQGTIGFGVGVLTVPILALVNPIMAPVPQLLMVLPLTVAVFWRERHHVSWSGTGFLLAGRLPGALLGIITIKVASNSATSTLQAVIALLVLLAVGLLSIDISVPRTRSTEFATGTTSGFMGMVASISGPPMALLYRNETGAMVRATLSAVFVVGVCITIATRAATGEIAGSDVQIAALLLPAQLVGFLLSFRLRGRVEGPRLRRAILAVSAVSAMALLISALR